MSSGATPKIALLGNPNAGKTSLFNKLTGLNQKTGNFPGVTVEKKSGTCILPNKAKAELTDLPGTYSLFPKTQDEKIVFDYLSDKESKNFPDLLIFVADVSNLRRNLLLFTQVYDLGLPIILVLNMVDVAEKDGLTINTNLLHQKLGIPVLNMNARKGIGIEELKNTIIEKPSEHRKLLFDIIDHAPSEILEAQDKLGIANVYESFQYLLHYDHISHLKKSEKDALSEMAESLDTEDLQSTEIIERYKVIDNLLSNVIVTKENSRKETLSAAIDRIILHKFWGIVIFILMLFAVFQAVFAWAQYPMELIDLGFNNLITFIQDNAPKGLLVDLLTEGVLAGIGGVVIFIPQIAILFACLSILEESGYMSRVVFIMDRIMQKFGLNGRSVVPLVSGAACAIPAIMSARSIGNWKERMITIFVTPLISCSARIPVYTILIALVVPETYLWGFLNLQGLTLLLLYILGFVAALGSAFVMKLLLKSPDKSFFVMEFPRYKLPQFQNVVTTIYNKTSSFVFEAGKVIIAIAIILWVLATYGPGDQMAQKEASIIKENPELSGDQLEKKISAGRIESSYAGHLGKFIEPAIKPLGFNWKIGIALLTSFAAREVFVGTMATIYSIEDDGDSNDPLKLRMAREVNPETGEKYYNAAVGFSLMVFYAFAMQCMSTIAVVYKETNSWKWPLLQFIYMTALAYVSSLLVFNLLS